MSLSPHCDNSLLADTIDITKTKRHIHGPSSPPKSKAYVSLTCISSNCIEAALHNI